MSDKKQATASTTEEKPLTRRERKRIAKKATMLETAMSIIVEGGMEALTIARLAERLDAAVGALYRYFPGKQALIVALQHQCLEEYNEILRGHLAMAQTYLDEKPEGEVSAASGFLLKLITLSYSYILDATESPTRHRLMDMMISTPDPVLDDDEAREVGMTLMKILFQGTEILIEAEQSGAFRSSPALFSGTKPDTSLSAEDEIKQRAWQRAHILWSHLHGLDHFRKRDRIQAPHLQVESLFQAGLRTLFLGWGAQPEALEQAFGLFDTFVLSSWMAR